MPEPACRRGSAESGGCMSSSVRICLRTPERSRWPLGIETDKGPWVQALVAAGYVVYAVNPRQVARYRDRHSSSGAKSDLGDAHTLADMVRTDRHCEELLAERGIAVDQVSV